MKPKQILKITTDLFMTVLLILLMAYSLIGEAAHEWLGVGMFLLFVLHHILNIKWCKNLFRGKYPPIRIFGTVLVLLVFFSMTGSMVSGILLSRHVFRLDIHRFSSAAQTIHMLCAYWGFLFLSLHLGLHWGGIMGMARKLTKKPSNSRKWILRSMAALVAVHGVYAFVKRDFGDYMLLRVHFVFFDFGESLILFLLDYVTIMGLFIALGYYWGKWLRSGNANNFPG